MKCTKCNQEIAKGSKFCIHCGASVDMMQMNMTSALKRVKTCPQCQKTFSENYVYCNNCGVMLQECAIGNTEQKKQTEHSMKWYKFIIYVQLFLSAIVSFASAISLLTGSYYGGKENADLVYYYYGNGLKIFDISLVIISLGLVVMAIVARTKLKNFKVGAPQFYLKLLILSCAVTVISVLVPSLITGEFLFNSSMFGSLAGNITMIFINKSYFEKRAELFCN